MPPEVFAYLRTQRVGVFAIEMPDGAPHAATVHFAHTDAPVFLFETYKEYRKAEPLQMRAESRASFVIGFDESNMKTLQMDGVARLASSADLPLFSGVYLGKFPEKRRKAEENRYVFFTFTPSWWRFTDWTRPEGKRIWSSDDN